MHRHSTNLHPNKGEPRFLDQVANACRLGEAMRKADFTLGCESMIPPPTIDGARVLEYAWSDVPFGVVRSTDGEIVEEIHGLAIFQYADSGVIYRFSCDKNWETSQDADHSSIQEAKDQLPPQYQHAPIVWHKYGAGQQDAAVM